MSSDEEDRAAFEKLVASIPLSILGEYAAILRELYEAFVGVDFTEDQAMQFVLVQWTETIRGGIVQGGGTVA